MGHKLLARHYLNGMKASASFVERFDRLDAMHSRSSSQAANVQRTPGGHMHGTTESEAPRKYVDWWKDVDITLESIVLRGPLRCACRNSDDGRVDMGPGMVTLYRCSWCAKTSALLRKCARCQNAWYVVVHSASITIVHLLIRVRRYCNAECQRAHWPSHKTDCRQL